MRPARPEEIRVLEALQAANAITTSELADAEQALTDSTPCPTCDGKGSLPGPEGFPPAPCYHCDTTGEIYSLGPKPAGLE